MNPAQLAGVSIGGSAAGGILGFFGNLSSGIAQSNMYEYQSAVAKINADIAAKNAEYALNAGETKAAEVGMAGRFKYGQTVARQGASNVRGGTTEMVRDSVRAVNQFDQDVTRQNAARVAFGYKTEEANAKAQAEMYGKASTNAMLKGGMDGLTSLIGGATSVANKWYQYKTVFGT